MRRTGEAVETDPNCTADIAALEAQIADHSSRIDSNAARLIELADLITDKESRIANNAARIIELDALIADKQTRIASNAARVAELDALIADKQTRIAANAARITELDALILDKQSRVTANATRVEELTELIGADEAELATLDPAADAARITLLTDRIAARETAATTLTTRNGELTDLIIGHETRAAELSTRNTELTDLVTDHETRMTELTDRNVILSDQRAGFEAELTTLQESCEPGEGMSLNYIHADHLGRPVFVTDPSGTVIWDAGITTPFGQSYEVQDLGDAVQTMAALTTNLAQPLMFPGQYRDIETGYDDNWHRTYDPALGRYLQSDPIGLGGGLNRYAYVGGNPVGYVDPTGELFFVPILIGMALGGAIDTVFQYFENGMSFSCFDVKRLGVSSILGAFGGGTGALLKNGSRKIGTEWSHSIAKRTIDKVFKPGSKLNKLFNKKGGVNGTWVSKERHAMHDWWRRIKGKKVTDKLPAPLRALDRIPDYMKASILASPLGRFSSDKNCECE